MNTNYIPLINPSRCRRQEEAPTGIILSGSDELRFGDMFIDKLARLSVAL